MKRTRNTAQRRAVLDAIHSLPGHPTAADVFGCVRAAYPHLSLATVYRALHALVEQGSVVEMRIANVSRYDAGPFPHHHIVCSACGSVRDIPLPLPPAMLCDIEQTSGYTIADHPA